MIPVFFQIRRNSIRSQPRPASVGHTPGGIVRPLDERELAQRIHAAGVDTT
jgi:hypothetical protein